MEVAHDPVTDLVGFHVGADLDHFTGGVADGYQAGAERVGVPATQHGKIPRVQRNRVDADEQFSALRARRLFVQQTEVAEAVESLEPIRLHLRKASRSAFSLSLCVTISPCGAPS